MTQLYYNLYCLHLILLYSKLHHDHGYLLSLTIYSTVQWVYLILLHSTMVLSGGFRNSERGVQPLAREARPQIFGLPRPLSVTLEVRTEYLEATLGLVKCLEINKELIRECVTMPGCCCCMPLLHNHLIDSCSYVRKNTLLAAKGGCICTPLTPPESPTGSALIYCTRH